MAPLRELQILQHLCKGASKENLYELIGEQRADLDHERLESVLKKKKKAWERDPDSGAKLLAVQEALKLLRTQADKIDYDRFLTQAEPPAPPPPMRPPEYQAQAPRPQPPPMRPPGYQAHPPRPQPMPPAAYQAQRPQAPLRPGAGLSNGRLVMVGLALVALSLLMTVPWGDGPPEISVETAQSEALVGAETAGAPTGAGGANEGRTPRSGLSSRDTSRSTGAEPSRAVSTPGREAEPSTAAADTTASDVGTGAEAAGIPTGAGGANEGRAVRRTPPSESESTGTEFGRPAPTPRRERDPGTAPSTTLRPRPVDLPTAPGEQAAGAGARGGGSTEAQAAGLARPIPPPVVEPVRVGGNVARPRKSWSVQPEYPRMARLRRIQGIVILEVTVDREGDVSNVSVLRSVEGLDEAAVEAVRQWRYEPTIVNGRPVSVVLTDTVRFEP